MPKGKVPEWLRLSFRDGVDERDGAEIFAEGPAYPYIGAEPWCWLAQFDPLQRPCAGPLERVHLISRQRIRNAPIEIGNWKTVGEGEGEFCWRWDPMILWNAEWDPRNARFGCGHEHHPRFDSKQMPTLIVPHPALPDHVHEFAEDYGLEPQLKEKFPQLDRQKEAGPK